MLAPVWSARFEGLHLSLSMDQTSERLLKTDRVRCRRRASANFTTRPQTLRRVRGWSAATAPPPAMTLRRFMPLSGGGRRAGSSNRKRSTGRGGAITDVRAHRRRQACHAFYRLVGAPKPAPLSPPPSPTKTSPQPPLIAGHRLTGKRFNRGAVRWCSGAGRVCDQMDARCLAMPFTTSPVRSENRRPPRRSHLQNEIYGHG
jgi:hypothetical protein